MITEGVLYKSSHGSHNKQIYLHQKANTYVLSEYVLTHTHSPNNITTHTNAHKHRITKTLKFSHDEEERIYLALQRVLSQHLKQHPQNSNFFTLELLAPYTEESDFSACLETVFAYSLFTLKSLHTFLQTMNIACIYAEVHPQVITFTPSYFSSYVHA